MSSGGKKGGQKVEITRYYMSIHYGVCTIVDAIKRIVIKEKEAWSGYESAQAIIAIDQEDLFGGDKKEGGVSGLAYFLPGVGTQVLPDLLAQKLGRANGADCPAFRGLMSVFFVGDEEAGFYWSANNPYLPGTWIEVERAPKGLTPSYAMIPRPGSDGFQWQSTATGLSSSSATFSFNRDSEWVARSNSNGRIEWWNNQTLTQSGASTSAGFATNSAPPAAVANDGTAYQVGIKLTTGGPRYLAVTPPLGAVTLTLTDSPTLSFRCTRVFDHEDGSRSVYTAYDTNTGYLNYTTHIAHSQSARDFALKSDDTDWGLFHPSGTSSNFTIEPLGAPGTGGTVTGLDSRGGPGTGYLQHVASQNHWFVISDSHWYTIDDTTYTIKASGAWSGTPQFEEAYPNGTVFWKGFDQYSLADGSLVQSYDKADWSGSPASDANVSYDPVSNGFWSLQSSSTNAIIRLIRHGILDANPAHIIYECLTNTDWGMGSPTSLIDVDSFEDAGVTLFNEPLGLSMIWMRQAKIQDFIQEVLDHIQAVLFVDPRTGLLTLKLIRGDYDEATLPILDESNTTLTNFGRKLWGEIVNEIVVTWTNPDNEQDETVTSHDLASIATQGSVISDSRNYYGVRYAALAKALAERDLRSAGAPLASCEAEVDRSQWDLRPASVVKINWPEYGLSGVVMRVTSVDYGRPGDMIIKLSLVEDVFGLDAADYVDPPSSIWEDTSQQPTPLDAQLAMTLPYFFNVANGDDVSSAEYPEVRAGVLAASDNTDTWSFELWDEVTTTDSSIEWQSLATLNLVGHAQLSGDLPAEVTSSAVSFDTFLGSETPVQNGFALIGDGAEDETEIALITGAGATFTLRRGVLDTTPKAWPAGTPVWFVDEDSIIGDPLIRSAGEDVSYRLRTRTSQGLLPLFGNPELDATLTERPWLPLRPANVTIQSVQFNTALTPVDATANVDPWVTVTWANRNRLTEDTQPLAWTDATVTPEDGQTTTITVYRSDGVTVLDSITGIVGTTYDVPNSSFADARLVLIVPTASRTDADGTFESLQGHGIWVQVGGGGSRVTEAGIPRVTEGGRIRATED